MKSSLEEFRDAIEEAPKLFDGAVSTWDVIAWLHNFDEVDWPKALILLNAFEYYTFNDIVRSFNEGLDQILNELGPNQKCYLLPVGKSGKSGLAMLYSLKKILPERDSRFSILEKSNCSTVLDDSVVVLVDDFSGSGGTICDFYDEMRSLLPTNHKAVAIVVAYLMKAKIKLNNSGIELIGNARLPAFTDRGSVFGYYPRMKSIREFCFKYGKKLYKLKDYKKGRSKMHPLGFENSQALIGFEHSIPNNTIPILWSDKKRKKGQPWTPLFPRRGKLLVQRAKEFKEHQRQLASRISLNGVLNNLLKSPDDYSRLSMQLLGLITLKRQQKNVVHICQLLACSLDEYEEIVQEGKNRFLLDGNEELTPRALSVVEQIRKRHRFTENNQRNRTLLIDEDLIYVPKVFRGNS